MNHSESIKELAAALAKAQGVMCAASKDGHNPHLRSKYATLGSIWDACRQPLADNGLSVVQDPQLSQGAVTVETLLMHAGGEWISSSLTLPCLKSDAQAVGAAITYARKYALAAVVGVAPEDEESALAAKAGKPGMARDEQIAAIWEVAKECAQEDRVTRAAMSRVYGVSEPYLLTESQADLFLGDLRLQLARQRDGSTLSTSTPPSPTAAPVDPLKDSVTLQEALTREPITAGATAGGGDGAIERDEQAAWLGALDSYLVCLHQARNRGPFTRAEADEIRRAMIEKRGGNPFGTPTREIMRDMTRAMETYIAAFTAQQRAKGVTCTAREATAVMPSQKSERGDTGSLAAPP